MRLGCVELTRKRGDTEAIVNVRSLTTLDVGNVDAATHSTFRCATIDGFIKTLPKARE
ncbi:hypothetical protein OKW39_004193 [Paraburkholderia sp. MM6662-R1]